MAWVFPSSLNRPLLFKAHAFTDGISRDRFPANSLALWQNPLDMLSRTKAAFLSVGGVNVVFFFCLYERSTIILVEIFSDLYFNF